MIAKTSFTRSAKLVAAFSAVLVFSSIGHSSEADALRLLGRRSGTSVTAPEVAAKNSKAKSKKKRLEKKTKSDPKAPLAARAEQELVLKPEDSTTAVISTPATVLTDVETVVVPETRPVLEFGVSLQPYRPTGRGHVTGFESYDLTELGTRPMPAFELRWLPLKPKTWPAARLGGFFSLGYTQHSVTLRGPTGATFDEARLHTVKTQAGVSAAFRLENSPRLSLRPQLGLGLLDSVQSSRAPEANQTGSLLFASAGVFAENRVSDRMSIFAGYELRSPYSKRDPGLDLPKHNFLIGIWGNLQ